MNIHLRHTIYIISFLSLWWSTVVVEVVAQLNPAQPFGRTIGKTLEETKQWSPQEPKAAKNTPNVIWILLDGVGFGATSTFGRLLETPTLAYLAANRLRYTNFHTTTICVPTCAALLTGRNAHSLQRGLFPKRPLLCSASGGNSIATGRLVLAK